MRPALVIPAMGRRNSPQRQGSSGRRTHKSWNAFLSCAALVIDSDNDMVQPAFPPRRPWLGAKQGRPRRTWAFMGGQEAR